MGRGEQVENRRPATHERVARVVWPCHAISTAHGERWQSAPRSPREQWRTTRAPFARRVSSGRARPADSGGGDRRGAAGPQAWDVSALRGAHLVLHAASRPALRPPPPPASTTATAASAAAAARGDLGGSGGAAWLHLPVAVTSFAERHDGAPRALLRLLEVSTPSRRSAFLSLFFSQFEHHLGSGVVALLAAASSLMLPQKLARFRLSRAARLSSLAGPRVPLCCSGRRSFSRARPRRARRGRGRGGECEAARRGGGLSLLSLRSRRARGAPLHSRARGTGGRGPEIKSAAAAEPNRDSRFTRPLVLLLHLDGPRSFARSLVRGRCFSVVSPSFSIASPPAVFHSFFTLIYFVLMK